MIFKKEELDEFPFSERLKWERAKVQNNPAFWINEYIHSHVPAAENVMGLVEYSKNVTEQLESIYGEIDGFLQKYGVTSLDELHTYIHSLKSQLESMYAEKEEAISPFSGIHDLSELKDLALGMEEQLVSMYTDKETV